MGERITIVLDDGVSEKLITLAGSSRKQGEFLSDLVRGAWDNRQAISEGLDVESLRYQFLGMAANVKQVEGRLLQVERQLAAVIANSGRQGVLT